MANTCRVCGRTLADSQIFCSGCGTKWEASTAEPEKKFCARCGSPLTPGTRFCAKCGTPVLPVRATSAARGTTASSPAPVVIDREPVASVTTPPQKPGGGVLKIVLAVLGFFILMGVLAMGSCAYLAYRAKTKVDRIQQAYKENDINKLAGELGVKDLAGVKNTSASPTSSSTPEPSEPSVADVQWKSYKGSPAASNASIIPLKQGLTAVGAVNMMPFGDYEAITILESVSPQGIGLEISSQAPPPNEPAVGGSKPSTSKSFQATSSARLVLSEDLAHAHEINLYFSNRDPKSFPGTTSGTISKEVFNEIKTNGETQLTYRLLTLRGAFTGLLDKLSKDNNSMNLQDLTKPVMTKIDCTLRKASSDDVAFPVILNDQRVELPAIHTVCKSDQDEFHLYVLDDAENPMGLSASSKLGHFRTQLIRITYPEDKPVNRVEQDLKETGRAKIYGIYFDFASATIRPQSAPVLQEIAKAMKDNPSWKLRIEGHTDNIGGDASNLDLSKRRAASVMQALTSQYRVATSRFTTAGFGASRPVDTNDTIEGRARNRRVELARQ